LEIRIRGMVHILIQRRSCPHDRQLPTLYSLILSHWGQRLSSCSLMLLFVTGATAQRGFHQINDLISYGCEW
jgi:hypothetical protein